MIARTPTTSRLCLLLCCWCLTAWGVGEKDSKNAAQGDSRRDDKSGVSDKTVVKALREKFPHLADVAEKPREFAEKILALKGERVDLGDGRVVNVKLLAAEILDTVGERKRAQSLWLEVFGTATEQEDKAAAMYAMGLHYLMRERYADCAKYWRFVPTMMPDSEWSVRVARYDPFLKLAVGLRAAKVAASREEVPEYPLVPNFQGSFGKMGAKSRDDFKGSWLVLDFWSSSSTRGEGYAGALRLDLDKARKKGWDGVVLGVNLDRSREAFENARANWKVEKGEGNSAREVPAIDWPQYDHDGLGFDSPIVRAFGIPRAPMRLVINPEGRLTYFTTPKGRILRALIAK